jgi:hypothetical protein
MPLNGGLKLENFADVASIKNGLAGKSTRANARFKQ